LSQDQQNMADLANSR